MTEKQIYSFCKKEYNRLRKEHENIWKKHDEIYDKEGMEKANNYLNKFHVTERMEFFRNCCDVFEGINRNRETIDNGTWIKNIKNKFINKLEKVAKSYDPENDNYKDFAKLTSEFKKDVGHSDDDFTYERMFDDDDFVKNIDDIADYSKRNKILDKFQIAIGVCYKSANRKFLKNKLLAKDCEALDRATRKLSDMAAEARLTTDDLAEFYRNASDMIDEYLYAKKIYDSLSNKLKNKIDREEKEWDAIDESVNYFPY